MAQDPNDYERELLANIDQHGWQFTFVFDPEGVQPDFGYSIGFTKTLRAPEFIVFGLPRELMNAMLWEVFRQIKAGAVPGDGKRWSGLLEGFECVGRVAHAADLYDEYAVSASWFWQRCGNAGEPEVHQIVWPGAQSGQFPWDEGCDPAIIAAQPALWQAG